MKWTDFVGAASLLDDMKKYCPELDKVLQTDVSTIPLLLAEAKRSTAAPSTGIKNPRKFVEVLLQSKHFEDTKEMDTIYAVLGMCAIPARTEPLTGSDRDRHRNAILVDYTKTIYQVYQDAAVFIFRQGKYPRNLTAMWTFYRRSPRHAQGLPSWVMDWRTSRCNDADMEIMQERIKPTVGEDTPCWIPLREDVVTIEDPQNELPLHADPNRHWHWPTPLEARPEILTVRGWALNYVAYFSDYTCSLESFLKRDNNGFVLGLAGCSMHAEPGPGSAQYLFEKIPRYAATFDPEKHAWRIAILGVANDAQIALVPSTAQRGDLLIAIAPQLPCFVLHPVHGDLASTSIFTKDELYTQRILGKTFLFFNLFERLGS